MSVQFWYLVRVLMGCSVDIDGEPLFSEEFVLVRAVSYDEAYGKAEAKGQELCHSYQNDAGVEVCWTFRSVLEVRRIMDDDIGDGCEIYARTWSTPPEVVPKGILDE
jgi:hypothetical protein